MVDQLNSKNITPIIFDNKSDSPVARNFLKKIHLNRAYVIHVGKNLRHKVGFLPGIYEFMPEVFAYTDPDLLFDSELPDNFLEILKSLTVEYGVFKAGSALVIARDGIDTDLKIECEGCAIYVDPKSSPYVQGMIIDYKRNGLNEGFEFVNPNERDRCGCGESFRI
jgi:iron-sulfur cluster assembly protein